MAEGSSRAAIMSETVSQAASRSPKTASSVSTSSGRGVRRTVISVARPSSPSLPTNSPTRSRPSGSGAGAARSSTSPVSVTSTRPSTLRVVAPYLKQCGPPAFSPTLPPIVQACWLEGSGA